jgi:hypothetical protein
VKGKIKAANAGGLGAQRWRIKPRLVLYFFFMPDSR